MNRLLDYQLRELVEKANDTECNVCNKIEYAAWNNKTQAEIDRLELIGEIADCEENIKKNGYQEYHPEGTNYWSKDAPVALSYYPYHESKVLRCPNCHSVFLYYVEYGGHGPQKRARWIRKETKVLSTNV